MMKRECNFMAGLVNRHEKWQIITLFIGQAPSEDRLKSAAASRTSCFCRIFLDYDLK